MWLADLSTDTLLFSIYFYTKLLTKDGEKKDDYYIVQNDFKHKRKEKDKENKPRPPL